MEWAGRKEKDDATELTDSTSRADLDDKAVPWTSNPVMSSGNATYDEVYTVGMKAKKDINEGEELCISYVDEEVGTGADRRTTLEYWFAGKCLCSKCRGVK